MPSPSPFHRYGVGGVINRRHADSSVHRRFRDRPYARRSSAPAARRSAIHLPQTARTGWQTFWSWFPGQVHRIAKFVVTPFTANREKLINRRQRQRVLPSTVLLSEVIGLLLRGFVLDFLTVVFQFAGAVIPTPIMADGVVLAFRAVLSSESESRS